MVVRGWIISFNEVIHNGWSMEVNARDIIADLVRTIDKISTEEISKS